MKGSVAVRRASSGGGTPRAPLPLPLHHHFPPMAVDSLHHHHANNHNSHQHMARIKAGVARTSSSSAASSSSVTSATSASSKERLLTSSSTSSSGAGGVAERLGVDRPSSGSSSGSERLTPRRFLEKYSLPRVVRVVSEPGADRRLSGPLAQPLLLYRQYTSCKVLARSLRREAKPTAQHATETGPPLVIPDSYQGWFSLVRERSLQTRAKVYTTIQQLVSARVAVFLSKSSLTGFKLAPASGVDGEVSGLGGLSGLAGRRLQYTRSGVRGGQVLRLLAVFEDNENGRSSTRSRRGRALPLGRIGNQPQQYAQCLTARNESVFVPVSTSGSFYAVATDDGEGADLVGENVDAELSRVYQLPQLLRLTADPLPVKVQLVCGPIQSPLPTGFSGLLVLEDLQQEDVVLACTLPRSWALPPTPTPNGNADAPGPAAAPSANVSTASSTSPSLPPPLSPGSDRPVFLEMDADSKFLLTRPLASREAEARFFKTPLLRRVLAHCRERADVWCSQIKVTHHVFPVAPDATSPGKSGLVVAVPSPASPVSPTSAASAASTTSGSTRSSSEQRALPLHGLFRPSRPARTSRDSALAGKASSLSSGGTKKSQSFRYASPAMMQNTASSSSSSGSTGVAAGPGVGAVVSKPPVGQAGQAGQASSSACGPRGTHRGAHQLLQQLQSLSGLRNLLRRSSSVSPSPQPDPLQDVPLSVVFPELFGQPAVPSAGAASSANSAGCDEGVAVSVEGSAPTAQTSITASTKQGVAAPGRQQHLRFYSDDLPYGRVADALPPSTGKARVCVRGRSLYDVEDDDQDDVENHRVMHHNDDDEENIYAEICECPRGVVVSGARVILTTACSEERRGYFTFASATSKDQYYTGGSDGTFSGTMSSSNPSNPEEDIYDNVC